MKSNMNFEQYWETRGVSGFREIAENAWNAAVSATVVKDDGWISNIGHKKPHHPDTLDDDAYIQVKYRDGSFDVCEASDRVYSWKETAGYMSDIVAYRVMK